MAENAGLFSAIRLFYKTRLRRYSVCQQNTLNAMKGGAHIFFSDVESERISDNQLITTAPVKHFFKKTGTCSSLF